VGGLYTGERPQGHHGPPVSFPVTLAGFFLCGNILMKIYGSTEIHLYLQAYLDKNTNQNKKNFYQMNGKKDDIYILLKY
jgi:hypothetical protein